MEKDLPICFNIDYYQDKIERCSPQSDNDYRWRSLLNYSILVKNFYNELMLKLNESIDQPANLPSYIKPRETSEPIDFLAQKLLDQERRLMICFDKSATKFEKKCEKHAALKELRAYGAKCWLLYQNYKRDNFYHAIIDFQTRNADKDLSDERNIALMYVGHVKTKNFVKTKVNNYFSTRRLVNPFQEKHPTSIGLYADIPTEPLFAEIINTFNGYNYVENEEYFNQTIPNLKDENAIKVVELYKHYPQIKEIYKKLLNVRQEEHLNFNDTFLDVDHLTKTGQHKDMYLVAEEYLEKVQQVLDILDKHEEYKFVFKDCIHLQSKLVQALLHTEKFHAYILERREASIKAFKEKHPDFKI